MDDDEEFLRLQEKVLPIQIRPVKPSDYDVCNSELPPRIFVRDYYRISDRVNAYSKPELLAEVATALKGTPELERIHKSQFEKFFEIRVRKVAFSGKIVHNLLCRQLWTAKPHEEV
ncbi:unnamed protein product [Arabis nemorensis]|uniref:Uncharacterized protein n=1 Tax=Arabis nemorensis TaxID=586526 RepID=A0A565BJ85_9BRAS|nr:unnamed protein product [Arabis nemorensis]